MVPVVGKDPVLKTDWRVLGSLQEAAIPAVAASLGQFDD